MSIEEIRNCDGQRCDKFTRDRMKDGWISIGDGGFTKYGGRNKENCAVTEIYIREGADFCSWECLKSKGNK